jgi:hypothetical protein
LKVEEIGKASRITRRRRERRGSQRKEKRGNPQTHVHNRYLGNPAQDQLMVPRSLHGGPQRTRASGRDDSVSMGHPVGSGKKNPRPRHRLRAWGNQKRKAYTEITEDAEFTEKKRETQEHSPFVAQGKQE